MILSSTLIIWQGSICVSGSKSPTWNLDLRGRVLLACAHPKPQLGLNHLLEWAKPQTLLLYLLPLVSDLLHPTEGQQMNSPGEQNSRHQSKIHPYCYRCNYRFMAE